MAVRQNVIIPLDNIDGVSAELTDLWEVTATAPVSNKAFQEEVTAICGSNQDGVTVSQDDGVYTVVFHITDGCKCSKDTTQAKLQTFA